MGTALSPTVAEAVGILQARVQRARPGSDAEQIAEKAIDYCLDRVDADGDATSLAGDAYRNARYVYYRSVRRRRAAMPRYIHRTYGKTVMVDDVVDTIDPRSLEDQVIENTSALCRNAIEETAEFAGKAMAFAEQLMAGDTLAEAARHVGVSRATAYRWRSALAMLLVQYR